MLVEFDLPSELEGVVCVQVFKASRGYADSAIFELTGPQVDGARLRLGQLPDEYLQLCGLLSAQLESILSGFKDYETRLDAAIERERRADRFRSRPMAMLIGWQVTPIRRRTPLGAWDWVDLVSEYRRGAELRDAVHQGLDRLAASLAVGLDGLVEDRVATLSFWIAPERLPAVIFRESAGSAEVFTTSGDPLPRLEVQQWVDRVSRLPGGLSDAVSEPLSLLAATKALESSWLRFTLGWAALERLGHELGGRFDDLIVVEQRLCPRCGAEVTDRRPTIRPRLEALMRALAMPDGSDLTAELERINRLRGRSHVGAIPEGPDLLAPEQLASAILRAVFEHPGRLPA